VTAMALQARTFRSLHDHRNYRLFFSGQVVSVSGTWMQNVALAWLVIQMTHSPLAVGALAFCRFVPFTVLGLVSGVLADRVDNRRLVIGTQSLSMVLSATLAVLALTGTATLPLVFLLAVLSGVAQVFDAPGRQALTYQLVGGDELRRAGAHISKRSVCRRSEGVVARNFNRIWPGDVWLLNNLFAGFGDWGFGVRCFPIQCLLAQRRGAQCRE